MQKECCAICGCSLHRKPGHYAKPTVEGRSHATRHHFVAERFFGRSKNRRGTKRAAIFESCPWGLEGRSAVFCYECHEELLHNPVLEPEDIERLADLVHQRGLSEDQKSGNRQRIAGRIRLLQEVISLGLAAAAGREM